MRDYKPRPGRPYRLEYRIRGGAPRISTFASLEKAISSMVTRERIGANFVVMHWGTQKAMGTVKEFPMGVQVDLHSSAKETE